MAIIWTSLAYLILLPILFRLLGVVDARLKAKKQEKLMTKKGGRAQALKNKPELAWPKWQERLQFTFKDKRNFILKKPKPGEEPKVTKFTHRGLFFFLYGAGLALAAVSGLLFPDNVSGGLLLFGLASALFFSDLIYGVSAADEVIKLRKKVYQDMFEIARAKLGLDGSAQPQELIRIKEWQDYIKPKKVEFDIPPTFDAAGEEGFLRQYNQKFGTETTWVPSDDPETNAPGWDYEKGILNIHAVPPLPQRADWHENYVTSDEVAWSFFPVAIGVENGLTMTNHKGEEVNVLGFDLSGEQMKLSNKLGTKLSPKITVSPMVLVAGATGGGKSLAIETLIEVIDE